MSAESNRDEYRRRAMELAKELDEPLDDEAFWNVAEELAFNIWQSALFSLDLREMAIAPPSDEP